MGYLGTWFIRLYFWNEIEKCQIFIRKTFVEEIHKNLNLYSKLRIKIRVAGIYFLCKAETMLVQYVFTIKTSNQFSALGAFSFGREIFPLSSFPGGQSYMRRQI